MRLQIDEYSDGSRTATIDRVLYDLRLGIISGKHETGEKIVEADLGKLYGVSRGSVRTALNVLQGEGLIRVLPNGRKEIVCLTDQQVRDLYDLRLLIENRALEIVIKDRLLGFSPMVEALEAIKASSEQSAESGRWYDLDIQFHRGLVLASSNLALYRAWEVNTPVMRGLMFRYRVQEEDEYVEKLYDDHREIFDLVVTGDERVFDLHRRHIMDACPKGQ